MFIKQLTLQVNSKDVVNFVRLLGRFGMRFEISNEYCKADDLDPSRKNWFRRFVIYGTRRKLTKFCGAINIS